MIFLVLIVSIICAIFGATIAGSKGRDSAVWGLICFVTGPVGVIILMVTADASPPQRSTPQTPPPSTLTNSRPASDGKGIVVKSYDEKKWKALQEVDPEIRQAAETVRALGSAYEDELAEKYLILSDKAYLPALVEKITTSVAEKTAKAADRAEAVKAGGARMLEDYQTALKENNGHDPETQQPVKEVSLYSGLAKAYVGGLKIVFADGKVAIRNGSARMQFRNEQEADDWG